MGRQNRLFCDILLEVLTNRGLFYCPKPRGQLYFVADLSFYQYLSAVISAGSAPEAGQFSRLGRRWEQLLREPVCTPSRGYSLMAVTSLRKKFPAGHKGPLP